MRSVRALVPDPWGFHYVTIVNMGDLPEPSVSIVSSPPKMARNGDLTYGVATAGTLYDRGQESVP